MKSTIYGIIIALLCSVNALANTHIASSNEAHNGLVRVKSAHDVTTTANNLESVVTAKGMIVIARIKHSQSAAKVGVDLRPTQLLIFGNPKVGSPLMVCQQTVAIDLPQKALIYQDENDQVWLTYNDPMYLVERHHIDGCETIIDKISKALAMFAKAATE